MSMQVTHSFCFIRNVAPWLLLASISVAGCDCGGDSDTTPHGSTSSTSSGPGSGGGGQGGQGGAGTGGGNGTITSSTVVLNDPSYSSPFDAALSKDGSVVYFTAIGPDGPGVFSIPAGGGTVLKLAAGDPFVFPLGVAVSTDGKTLYVADLGAEGSDALGTDGGKIFGVPAEGGAAAEVLSTDNTRPRGLDVADESGADQIYFTGTDGVGTPGLFKVAAKGGEPTAVATGAPFVDPSGVTVEGDKIYVLDTVASSQRLASVIEVSNGMASEFLGNLPVGYPAGLALSADGSAILVSGLDAAKGTTAVLRLDILSKELQTFPKMGEYDGYHEPAGLHRSKGGDVYAFVDSSAKGGTVFLLK